MPDWNHLRSYYPVTRDKTYLKSASIGGIHQDVLNTITSWEHSIATDAGVHEERFGELVFSSRDQVATFLNTSAEQVTLTENTSHNMNLAAMMLKQSNPEGLEVIAPADEFPSSILPFYHHGFAVKQVPSQNGVITIEDLLAAITRKTKAVVCSHVQFSTGHRTDIYRLSEEIHKRGLHLIINATQSLGVFPIDLGHLKVSMLTASCHKWMGASMGRSVLYMSEDFMSQHRVPLLGWCSVEDPFAMENKPKASRKDVAALQLGIIPFPLLAGVQKAMEIHRKIGLENISNRVLDLSQLLRSKLAELDLEILGSSAKEHCSGITTFAIPKPADELVEFLMERKIHVNNRRGLIRAALHFYNNVEDIEKLITALKEFL